MITNGREWTSTEWLAEMRAMEVDDDVELAGYLVAPSLLPPPPAAEANERAAERHERLSRLVAHLHERDIEQDTVDGEVAFV